MVDYCNTDISLNPSCPHGPTLLFSKKESDKQFYACSAFRDRKQCSFFVWQEELHKKQIGLEQNAVEVVQRKHKNLNESYCYCYTCEALYPPPEQHLHKNHNVKESIGELLHWPSMVINPKTKSKGESQYYFSEGTVKTITGFLATLKVDRVLCIGCPYLHEYISNKEKTIQSFLLDIDHRYGQFYDSSQFQPFNTFNCHFFNSNDGWLEVRKFSSNQRIAIFADPPFGGRLEPIQYTFNRLFTELCLKPEISNLFLILPYFMEPALKRSFPDFRMLDYRVEYRNHNKFKRRNNETGTSKSAVRMFTNVELGKFHLPEEEGYKFCEMCEYWVCNENNHCFKCETCTSKNGEPYRHCDSCKKCVKKTWRHCYSCGFCKLKEHKCVKDAQVSKTEGKTNFHKNRKKKNTNTNAKRRRN